MSDSAFPAGITARHGTESGWAAHQRLGQLGACAACMAAKSQADKRRMEADSELVIRNRLGAKAQRQAYKRLADAYPDEYREHYVAIKADLFAKAGLQPRKNVPAVQPPPRQGQPDAKGSADGDDSSSGVAN